MPEQNQAIHDTYRRVFRSEDGQKILGDLALLARWDSTEGIGDPHILHFIEGQRSVMRHIRAFLDMTDKEVADAIRAERMRLTAGASAAPYDPHDDV